MPVKKYIDENFNGNISHFAKSQGVQRQQVQKWITKDYIIYQGKLWFCSRGIV